MKTFTKAAVLAWYGRWMFERRLTREELNMGRLARFVLRRRFARRGPPKKYPTQPRSDWWLTVSDRTIQELKNNVLFLFQLPAGTRLLFCQIPPADLVRRRERRKRRRFSWERNDPVLNRWYVWSAVNKSYGDAWTIFRLRKDWEPPAAINSNTRSE